MPAHTESPLILIADDSEVSRQYLSATLQAAGFRTIQAIDGGSALKVVMEHDVTVAIIDHFMAPFGGLDFARKVQDAGKKIPMIMVTNEETSDLLIETSRHGIGRYLRKPVEPQRLVEAVKRSLREVDTKPVSRKADQEITGQNASHTNDDLMRRVIELAHRNAQSRHGGPFGALVADTQGRIVGQGVNGISSRSDPTAHAEVMAIRQATETLNQTHLRGCVLYASSEPTTIGKALIAAVGITRVVYGLSHDEMHEYMGAPTAPTAPVYEQSAQAEARAMMQAWKDLKDGVHD
jgi:guanine deaminase